MPSPVRHAPLSTLALLAAFALGVSAADTQRYLIVRIEGHDEKITYEIFTPEQHKELLAELRLEGRFHDQALTKARALWRESQNGKRSFPTQAIQRRNASVEGASHMSMERAQSQKESLKRRLETKSTLGERRYSNSSIDETRKDATRRTDNAFSTNAYENEQNRLDEAATKLYISQLTALVAAAKAAEKAPAIETTEQNKGNE